MENWAGTVVTWGHKIFDHVTIFWKPLCWLAVAKRLQFKTRMGLTLPEHENRRPPRYLTPCMLTKHITVPVYYYILHTTVYYSILHFAGSHRQHVSYSIIWKCNILAVTAHGYDEIPQIVHICILSLWMCELCNLKTNFYYCYSLSQKVCYWPLGIYHVFIGYFHAKIK